jgi:2-methylfumaryl-CoA hydratase
MKISNPNIAELSAKVPADLAKVKYKQYGKYLGDFVVGETYEHPRGMTVTAGLIQDFATTFLEANPLYLNLEYAKALGHPAIPASPLLVFNLLLSLGVQNDSEKAYANLGYYNVKFLKNVYPGDTITSFTKIIDKKERGEGKPGIVTINTIGNNQRGERVAQYTRKIMVPPAPAGYEPPKFIPSKVDVPPYADSVEIEIPDFDTNKWPSTVTRPDTYYEDFNVGDIIVSPNGRTITDEHFAWTYRVGNTHPLHFDRLYSQGMSGAMSGEPITYGGLVFAWLLGLASRDISENALADLGYTEGYHTQPSKSGETLYCIHRVLAKEPVDARLKSGAIQFQVIGLRDIKPKQAIEKYGIDLFIKENDKKDLGKEKIPEKIFEIERRLLIRTRA